MKRKLCFLLALTMVLLLLAGCQKTPSDNGDNDAPKINLTYFGYKADTMNLLAIEDAIQSFQTKHANVNITYEGIKGDDYYKKLDLRVKTGNLDDMFMVDRDSSVDLIQKGLLEDLSDIVDPAKFVSSVAGQFVNEDGSIYLVPTAMVSFGLYCNMTLLRAHGFTKAPTNFGELKEMCDYFVGKGITPIVANNRTSVWTLTVAKGMYDVYQSEDYADTIRRINAGEIDLAEQLKPGVEMVHQMLEDGWIDGAEAAATAATKGDLTLFRAGDRPFMVTGTWASPRLAGEDGGVNFDYAIYPYPVLESGSVLVLNIATCMSVNAKGEHKDAAKEFVKHMIQPEVIWSYCDSQSSFTPVLGDDRLPTDTTTQPQVAYLSNGQNVLASDYHIVQPVDSALQSVGATLLKSYIKDENAPDKKPLTLDETLALLRAALQDSDN